MGKGISISIAADTKDAQRGIQRGLIEPLEDASTALTDLERDGQDAGRALERTFSEQQRETEQLRKEFDKLGDQIRTSGRRARDFGDDVKTGTDKAKRGMEDFKDEANSTAREAAASFDGSAESAADAFQEVAANAFAGFGPAGATAGLLAAAGLGVALSAITAQQEAADELKRRFSDAYQSAAEEGRVFLDEAQIQAAALDILFDTDQRKQAAKDAETLGVDLSTMVLALAGDQDALNAAIQIGVDKQQELNDTTAERLAPDLNYGARVDAEAIAVDGVISKLQVQKGIQQENVQAAEDAIEVQQRIADTTAAGNAAAKKAIDERGAALQAYADKAASIPNPVLVPRVDTGPAESDLQEFLNRRRQEIEIGIRYRNGKPVI